MYRNTFYTYVNGDNYGMFGIKNKVRNIHGSSTESLIIIPLNFENKTVYCVFIDIKQFKMYCADRIYSSFTGTHKIIWLLNETNNN